MKVKIKLIRGMTKEVQEYYEQFVDKEFEVLDYNKRTGSVTLPIKSYNGKYKNTLWLREEYTNV